jgi:hypothetical protein
MGITELVHLVPGLGILFEHAVVILRILQAKDLALSHFIGIARLGIVVDQALHPREHFVFIERGEKMERE